VIQLKQLGKKGQKERFTDPELCYKCYRECYKGCNFLKYDLEIFGLIFFHSDTIKKKWLIMHKIVN